MTNLYQPQSSSSRQTRPLPHPSQAVSGLDWANSVLASNIMNQGRLQVLAYIKNPSMSRTTLTALETTSHPNKDLTKPSTLRQNRKFTQNSWWEDVNHVPKLRKPWGHKLTAFPLTYLPTYPLDLAKRRNVSINLHPRGPGRLDCRRRAIFAKPSGLCHSSDMPTSLVNNCFSRES